jgi:hypothetical protein
VANSSVYDYPVASDHLLVGGQPSVEFIGEYVGLAIEKGHSR